MFWLVTFALLASLSSFCDLGTKNNKVYALIFVGILMSLTAGLRNVGGIGADYNIYMDHYNGSWIYGGQFDGYFEIGYCCLVWLCSHCGLSYNLFIFFLTSTCLFFLLRIIYRKSKYPLLSILLYISTYFLFYNMVLLRQMVSIVAFIYCIQYLIEGKKSSFFYSFIIGLLFHYSIVVLLLAYFILRYWKINFYTVSILLVTAIIFRIIGIETIFNLLSLLGNNILLERTADYLGNNSFSLNPIEYVRMFVYLFLISLFYRRIKNIHSAPILIKSYLCFCFVIIAFGNIEIFFRIAMYFDLASLFLIPLILDSMELRNSLKLSLYYSLAIFTAFSFIYRAINFNDGEFLNYNFYFLQ